MSLRLVINFEALPGKGNELFGLYKARCEDVMKEPGCLQFEVFQSVLDPDRMVVLEHWADEAALAAHAKVNETRAPLPVGLRASGGEREDYEYNRTR